MGKIFASLAITALAFAALSVPRAAAEHAQVGTPESRSNAAASVAAEPRSLLQCKCRNVDGGMEVPGYICTSSMCDLGSACGPGPNFWAHCSLF